MTINSCSNNDFSYIKENLKYIRDDISEAAVKSGRAVEDIRLMAVTKTVCAEKINYAINECGIKLIGENKVQEFLSKKNDLALDGVEKHLIGHLQTNKVKKIINQVDMIQSVDSLNLASVISKESEKAGVITDILLEINIGEEVSKTGFDKASFTQALEQISALDFIRVKGLMTIPPICEDENVLNAYFQTMSDYYNELKQADYKNFDLQILSMGMSGDFKQAIRYGSNLVRIGSAIFGARIYK